MQPQTKGEAVSPAIDVDDELNRLTELVAARHRVRECFEALKAYTDMAKRRQAVLKDALAAAQAEVNRIAGIPV